MAPPASPTSTPTKRGISVRDRAPARILVTATRVTVPGVVNTPCTSNDQTAAVWIPIANEKKTMRTSVISVGGCPAVADHTATKPASAMGTRANKTHILGGDKPDS
jgi:hypothetical protein